MGDRLGWLDDSTPAFWRVSKMRHDALHALLVGLRRARDGWRRRYLELRAELDRDVTWQAARDRLDTAIADQHAAEEKLSAEVERRESAEACAEQAATLMAAEAYGEYNSTYVFEPWAEHRARFGGSNG